MAEWSKQVAAKLEGLLDEKDVEFNKLQESNKDLESRYEQLKINMEGTHTELETVIMEKE